MRQHKPSSQVEEGGEERLGGAGGGCGWGRLVHKLAGQASRQAMVHLRTEAAPFHHSTVH